MEVEDLDDDMVVIIVGEDAADDAEPAIKLQDPYKSYEETDTTNVDYLEAAENCDDDDDDDKVSMVKLETCDGDSDGIVFSDEEPYLRGFDEEEHLEELVSVDGDHKPVKNRASYGTKRTRMIRPSARRSYIQQMIKECPSLGDNEDELVKRVADIMMAMKPPKPPNDFCTYSNGDGSFKCTTCGTKKSTMMDVARHWQEQHGQRYLKCFACGVDFRCTSSVQRHEKRCLAADAVVVLKARAIAVGNKGRDRPFLPPKVQREKKQYTYKRTFRCSMCPATFTSRMPLDAHENLHRGERPYTCEYCLMPYASYSALSRHRLSHGDQVFICDHCERPFKTKHLLISHIRTHGERRFACKQCGIKYTTKFALNNHVWRVHLKLQPPAACPVCPKRYARNSNLKLHMKSAHGMELITRNMYIKSLPKLTELELERAKVIMKTDPTEFPFYTLDSTDANTEKGKHTRKRIIEPKCIQINGEKHKRTIDLTANDDQKDDDNENKIIVDISDTHLTVDVAEFVRQLHADAVEEGRKVNVLLMDSGIIVNSVESENDATKLLEKLKEIKREKENVADEMSVYKEMTVDLDNNGCHKSILLQIQKDS